MTTPRVHVEDIAQRLHDYAECPAQNGFVPIHPDTLREAVAEIDRLRSLPASAERLRTLLSEALDLSVRAKKLDRMEGRGTPIFWAQDAYETDLANWQRRAKNALL